MGLLLARIVPHDQLVAVHAPLGELEWPGTIEHIRDTIPPDVPLILAPVTSGKTLLQRAEERGNSRAPGNAGVPAISSLRRSRASCAAISRTILASRSI